MLSDAAYLIALSIRFRIAVSHKVLSVEIDFLFETFEEKLNSRSFKNIFMGGGGAYRVHFHCAVVILHSK